jgi:predicted NBD/HSP70 family sugar kinase
MNLIKSNINVDDPQPSAAKPKQLKVHNRKIVMSAFQDATPHSIIDISQQTGVSRQTVAKALDHFLKLGIVEICGKGDSTDNGGKKPNIYQLSSVPKFLVVHLHEYYIELFDLNCNLIGRQDLNPLDDSPHDFDYYLNAVRRMADDLFEQNEIDENDLYGVVAITPGPVIDHAFVHRNPFCSEWGFDIPVKEKLEAAFPTAKCVFADNIGKLAGLGSITANLEFCSTKRVVTVYTAKGINGCFFDHGQMIEGSNSIIGEFGHMILKPDYPVSCICGKHGCFESIVKPESIRSRLKQGEDLDSFLSFVQKPLKEIMFDDVVKGFEKGFACCQSELKTLAACFGQAFLNISLVYDPDVFIIEGFFSGFNDAFETELYNYLSDFSLLTPDRYFRIVSDPQPLPKLEVAGAITALKEYFFSDDLLYV